MKARTQDEHEAINAREWPGTRQLCERCGEPTERCEEDTIYDLCWLIVCAECDAALQKWSDLYKLGSPQTHREALAHLTDPSPPVTIYRNDETGEELYSVAAVVDGRRGDLWLDSFGSEEDAQRFCDSLHLRVVEVAP